MIIFFGLYLEYKKCKKMSNMQETLIVRIKQNEEIIQLNFPSFVICIIFSTTFVNLSITKVTELTIVIPVLKIYSFE